MLGNGECPHLVVGLDGAEGVQEGQQVGRFFLHERFVAAGLDVQAYQGLGVGGADVEAPVGEVDGEAVGAVDLAAGGVSGLDGGQGLLAADESGGLSDAERSGFDNAHNEMRRSRSAFPITETELKLIAAAAIIGFSNKPKGNGYTTPAAIGTPRTL